MAPDHLYVAISLREQANSFRDQGDNARAEELFDRSVGILEATVDQDHPEFAETREQYAAMLRALGQEERAELMDSD